MKDLTEKIYDELNAQVVRMLNHSLNQASRIVELETQLKDHSAQAFSIGETYANALSRIAELEAQIAAASSPADKLRETILALRVDPPRSYDNAQISAFCFGAKVMSEAAADLAASTALQAPVREVPGYKLVPLEVTDAMLEAWKHELCIPVGSSPEAKARRAYKAMLAAAPLPAAPVQEPKP